MMSSEFVRNVAAASTAGACQPFLFNSLDCLRIRQQVAATSSSSSLFAFARAIVRDEGVWRGLHRPGLGINMTAVFFSQGLRYGGYPVVRDALAVRPGDVRPVRMAIAGMLTGSIAYLVCAPIFLIKTREQAAAQLKTRFPLPRSVREAWLGAGPLVIRGALLTGGQLTGYDGTKRFVKQRRWLDDGPILHAVAAVVAALCAASFSAPADVLQTAMQTQPGRSAAACARDTWSQRGVAGFYRGWSANVARLIPTIGVGTSIYEQVRRAFGLRYLE